ncbi:hypothetical protein [Mucilaginibacter auburnensis]|uniref:Uncharacterized protein n=1 Tax=Mucilaginibacter auburnensis TaxID=1457233 RepID=A0A2H9VL81_9SPHI|nr:hypothetical protein [Mucilaginibacter auburnensis]PJJ79098.1 hypothetical protein CLV57_2222 [Mucilaginibacter auburnensis]
MKRNHILRIGTLIVSLGVQNGYSQKLPNIQKESVVAPVNIKVDGKATEWDSNFKAQNSATELLYTLSNDNNNLYLIVQTKYRDVIDKIMRGGITLNVYPTLNKKSENHVSVTYPWLDGPEMSKLTGLLAVKNYPESNRESEAVTVDDLNKAFKERSKLIAVAGFSSVNEPEISVYNDAGIQAAANFVDEYYTCELAVPLKYLLLPDKGSKPFAYQIKVNEPRPITPKYDGSGTPPPPPPPMLKTAVAATDFWGEYTLAGK